MTKKPAKAAIAPARGRSPEADEEAAAPVPNRATRAAERRAAIVEAAMEEFISRGFAATRLDDIAKRAGVAKGTIYLHFKDKESMFEELVRTVIVAEGPRFPSVADFYYREVVSRGIAGMRALIELGIARGEIREKDLARYPQILVAPAMIAVIWQSLFARHAPLDAQDMLRVHLDLIFGERRTT